MGEAADRAVADGGAHPAEERQPLAGARAGDRVAVQVQVDVVGPADSRAADKNSRHAATPRAIPAVRAPGMVIFCRSVDQEVVQRSMRAVIRTEESFDHGRRARKSWPSYA
ncbi:hypothetical protein GCM10010176_031080 [Nonomuraea spiralis]|nr:hypothetical protein GCM10010176_031080 [Nonomuraea spiralis]